MATPTFVAEDADELYTRILEFEIELMKENATITKERSKEIENAIDSFESEYNTIYPSLKEYNMQDRIANISQALQRINQIAIMRWFMNNSSSNSGLNSNSNNMRGGRKSRKVKAKARKVNTRKSKARKVNTRKSRKSRSKK